MGYLTIYILIGLLFIWAMDLLSDWTGSEIEINNKERIVIAIFWPLGFLIFTFTTRS